jgi:two-component system, OmpR family, KDP operon response regulator KdpE
MFLVASAFLCREPERLHIKMRWSGFENWDIELVAGQVWGPECGYEREYLRSFVRQLRLKIEDNPADPKYLLTEPNIGYRFTESLEGDSAISSSNPVVAEA